MLFGSGGAQQLLDRFQLFFSQLETYEHELTTALFIVEQIKKTFIDEVLNNPGLVLLMPFLLQDRPHQSQTDLKVN